MFDARLKASEKSEGAITCLVPAKNLNVLSRWIITSKGDVDSIAIRGDTIYGLIGGKIHEQRLTDMTEDSEWVVSDLEDDNYPSSGGYLSIMVNNDNMYACGLDKKVYAKTLVKPVTYSHHLLARGSTEKQALKWNLTDITGTSRRPDVTMPPESTLPPHQYKVTTTEMIEEGPSTGTTTTKKAFEAGVMPHYVDRFQDVNAAYHGAQPVNTNGFDDIEDYSIQDAMEHNPVAKYGPNVFNTPKQSADEKGNAWHTALPGVLAWTVLTALHIAI